MSTFKFEFTMNSDWSVSTGSVRQGALDSVVYRDAKGLPALPFSTIRGLWRDSAELLAGAMGDAAWDDAVGLLFGDEPGLVGKTHVAAPRPSRLQATDACLPKTLSDALAMRPLLKSSLTFVKPGVAICNNTGMAKDDMLRFDEMANAGLVLEGEAELDVDGLQNAENAVFFLKAALLLVTHVGGNRRRGAGRCSVKVNGSEDVAGSVKVLKGKTAPTFKFNSSMTPPRMDTKAGTGEWQSLRLNVTIESPTVIAKQVSGNTTTCESFIPGTALIAPVLKLLADKGQAEDLFNRLAAADIIVEPAYPTLGGKRATPVPAFWYQHKDETGGPDGKGEIVAGFPTVEQDKFETDSVAKSLSGRFFVIGKNKDQTAGLSFVKAERAIKTRNVVNDLSQKPDSDTGGVFSHEHLVAGQTFAARIRFRKGAFKMPSPLPKTADAFIGTAKATGMGRVKLDLAQMEEAALPTPVAGIVHIWLTSPALIDGHAAGASLKDTFKSLLGLVKSDVAQLTGPFERLDGWVSSWALPRGSLFAFGTGTTARIELDESDIETLKQKLRDGIGVRRGEGFGMVALADDSVLEAPQKAWVPDEVEGSHPQIDFGKLSPIDKSKLPKELAERIEEAGVQELMRLQAEALATNTAKVTELLGFDLNGRDSKSQVGNLRSVMGGFSEKDRVKATQQFLKSTAEKHAKEDKSASWAKTAQGIFGTDDNPPHDKLWKAFGENFDKLLEQRLLDTSVSAAKNNVDYWRYAMRSFVHAAMKYSLKHEGKPNDKRANGHGT